MSRLTDFLKDEYVPHHKLTWDSATMTIKNAIPVSAHFEIEDKKADIVQPDGEGVAVFRQGKSQVEVVDIEAFMKTVHQASGSVPSCCDFALTSEAGMDYIVLNELTHTKSDYVLPFTQPKTGERQEGKLEKARRQLITTIEHLYEVSSFCDQYDEKTALFSCRLSDKRGSGVMARSARAFNSSIYKLQKIKLKDKLPHGFTFKMRIYNNFYNLK